jgi:hypothetical protein
LVAGVARRDQGVAAAVSVGAHVKVPVKRNSAPFCAGVGIVVPVVALIWVDVFHSTKPPPQLALSYKRTSIAVAAAAKPSRTVEKCILSS